MAEPLPFIDLGPYVQLVRTHRAANGLTFDYGDVQELISCHDFIGGGTTTQKLERALEQKLAVQHAVTCANGTDALILALRACGIDRGHRVAIPNLTFWATYEAVIAVGATPVVIDIDPDDLQMDFSEFIAAHNKRRFDSAILVHLYGWCSARLTEFRSLCRTRYITLIEDGAQAFGTQHDDVSVFADADIATLSFHPAKVIGGIGDGGAVLTKNARTAARVRVLGNHGRTGHYRHAVAGQNSRMDAIQAAWLLRALEVSDQVIDHRRVASRALTPEPPFDRYVVPPASCTDNGYLNVLLAADAEQRDVIRKKLTLAGVQYGTVYPTTIADQEGASGAIVLGEMATSRRVANTVVNLPLFYGITNEQIERVVGALR